MGLAPSGEEVLALRLQVFLFDLLQRTCILRFFPGAEFGFDPTYDWFSPGAILGAISPPIALSPAFASRQLVLVAE